MKILQKYSFLFLLVAVLIGSYYYFIGLHNKFINIRSFNDCIEAGFKPLLTYPETCKIPGKIFTNENQKKENTLNSDITVQKSLLTSYKDLTYFIDGQKLQMVNGKGGLYSSSSQQTLFTISDNVPPLVMNTKNNQYIFFLIKRVDGERSQGYYLAGALGLNSSFVGLNLLFLDMIASSTKFDYTDDTITITYTSIKDQQKQKKFIVENNLIKEIK